MESGERREKEESRNMFHGQKQRTEKWGKIWMNLNLCKIQQPFILSISLWVGKLCQCRQIYISEDNNNWERSDSMWIDKTNEAININSTERYSVDRYQIVE